MSTDEINKDKHDLTTSNNQCSLHELIQHHCQLLPQGIVCKPIGRYFRRCPGRAAVEVTHVVEYDRLGNVHLPPEMEKAMPPAQHWKDSKR